MKTLILITILHIIYVVLFFIFYSIDKKIIGFNKGKYIYGAVVGYITIVIGILIIYFNLK